ncbi:MAG TPA: CPBP family intramembrane glutamic endopeptidase [Acidimicrobiales bacterium]|nr:CPBP family intramembrane glutamic endopeptidase [Acidimicrobiales bacterium]
MPAWAPPAAYTGYPAPYPGGLPYQPAPEGPALPPLPPVRLDPPSRNSLVWETRFVMVAFLAAPLLGAAVLLASHVAGTADVSRFPTIVHQPLTNMILGIIEYLPVAAVVPIALFLLLRTGQPPSSIGLGRPRFLLDIWPGLGLAVLSYVTEIAVLIPLLPFLEHATRAVNKVPVGNVPHYYVIWGLAISFTTAVAEEVLVNGYLITRLDQLGWTPRAALILSLVLRTSYHIYYGLAFLLTIPFGFYVTRSFQKHRRLNRSIAAHFIYDASLFTLAILT